MQKYPKFKTMHIRTLLNFQSTYARLAGIACLVLIGLSVSPLVATGQSRFKAGIVAGLTAFQIDGDNSAGFNKLGLQGGFRGIALLRKNMDISFDMLFTQRGSQSQLIRDQYAPYFSFTTNHVEVPVQFHIRDWLVEYDDAKENFYRVSLDGGFSYARLIGYKFSGEPNGMDRVAAGNYMRKNDFSLQLGISYFFSRHFGISVQYNHSLDFEYNPNNFNPAPLSKAWLSYGIYFQGIYLF
jgi:hypothetical protein